MSKASEASDTVVRLVDHQFARPGEPVRPVDETLLVDYLVGSTGVYARGRRPGLEVCVPASFSLQPIRGLAGVQSYAQWGFPKVPASLLQIMLTWSKAACSPTPRETLFHLWYGGWDEACCKHHVARSPEPTPDRDGQGWHLEFPNQKATAESVVPTDDGAKSSKARALIEVHSHHSMEAVFSAQDNEDESTGFRIYAVLGNIFREPAICARVGLFGHFCNYSAAEFFELPDYLRDLNLLTNAKALYHEGLGILFRHEPGASCD